MFVWQHGSKMCASFSECMAERQMMQRQAIEQSSTKGRNIFLRRGMQSFRILYNAKQLHTSSEDNVSHAKCFPQLLSKKIYDVKLIHIYMRNNFHRRGMQLFRAKSFQIPSYLAKKCERIAPCPRKEGRVTPKYAGGDLFKTGNCHTLSYYSIKLD